MADVNVWNADLIGGYSFSKPSNIIRYNPWSSKYFKLAGF